VAVPRQSLKTEAMVKVRIDPVETTGAALPGAHH
jgi:hypothetical protein